MSSSKYQTITLIPVSKITVKIIVILFLLCRHKFVIMKIWSIEYCLIARNG